jgi:hypothetical protein
VGGGGQQVEAMNGVERKSRKDTRRAEQYGGTGVAAGGGRMLSYTRGSTTASLHACCPYLLQGNTNCGHAMHCLQRTNAGAYHSPGHTALLQAPALSCRSQDSWLQPVSC